MQTSAKKLSALNQKKVVEQFATLLADLHKPSDVQSFLQAFMTKTEQLVFAKRLAIIWELEQGLSYQEIKQKLKVSSATISSFSQLRKKQGMKVAMTKLKLDSLLERVLSKFYIMR